MANTLDGGDVEATFILLLVAGNLVLSIVPWEPLKGNFPLESSDPSSGAEKWNTAISVT